MRISDWSSDVCSADLEFEATEVMANFGQQHSLTLQPIYEGDIQEPLFADITDTQAIWPADSGAILHCDPKALIRISIKSGCDDAPYRERDVDNPDWEPKRDRKSPRLNSSH